MDLVKDLAVEATVGGTTWGELGPVKGSDSRGPEKNDFFNMFLGDS